MLKGARPPRGMADRLPDGRRDADHLRRGACTAIALAAADSRACRTGCSSSNFELGAGAVHLSCSSGWPSSAPPTVCAPASTSASTSSSTGWRPKTRAKFIVFGLLAGALFTGSIGTLGAHSCWDNGAHYAISRLGWHRRSAKGRRRRTSRADLDRLFGDSVRLVSDVLPLPAGHVGVPAHRRAAAPRPGHVEGSGIDDVGRGCRKARRRDHRCR